MSLVSGATVAATIALAGALSVAGQATNRGVVDEDVQVTTSYATTGASRTGDINYRITNLYSSPLVAIFFSKDCGPKHTGRVTMDAALDHATPLGHGGTTPSPVVSDPPACKVKLTAAIFGDGRQDGDEETIQWLLKRRAYALLQLQPVADLAKQEYLSEVTHRHSFDPAVIERAIEDRQVKLEKPPANGDLEKLQPDIDKYGAQNEVLDHLLEYTHELEALKNEPDYGDWKRAYIGILEEWSRALQYAPYPTRPAGLRFPR